MRLVLASSAGAAAIGLAAAACSSGTTSAAPSQAASAASGAARSAQTGGAVTVSLKTVHGIPGKALVDSHGRTLYLFEGDHGSKPTCAGACAKAWPPYTATGPVHAGGGITQAQLGAVHRAGGAPQVTYHGHPLYYFSGDTRDGSAKGEGVKAFGADWYMVSASGKKIDTD